MTQEQKQIKLAEAEGWEVVGFTICRVRPDKNGDPELEPIAPIPDYFNDLNAVHELEEELDDSQKMLYVAKLSQILSPSKFPQSFRILHATAEQRCEALGLTLNLW